MGTAQQQQRDGNGFEHIFVSYAREDREQVQRLSEALGEQGWSVWWDRGILPGGRWHQVLQEQSQSQSQQ